jgi:predicted transcriptional regulator
VTDTHLISLTADIVSAHVSHNNVATADVPALIESVFGALSKTTEPLVVDALAQEPAVSIRSSIKPDYLVCLEDGAKLKMLKRYLRTNYDMSPEDYRAKWKLPRDYPMVAPNYAETRRALAHKIGLGRKAVDKAPASAPAADGAAKSAGRKRLGISAAKEAAQQHLGTAPTEAVDG